MLLLQILTIDIVALSFFNVKYGKDDFIVSRQGAFLPFSFGWKNHDLNGILLRKGSILFYLVLPIFRDKF